MVFAQKSASHSRPLICVFPLLYRSQLVPPRHTADIRHAGCDVKFIRDRVVFGLSVPSREASQGTQRYPGLRSAGAGYTHLFLGETSGDGGALGWPKTGRVAWVRMIEELSFGAPPLEQLRAAHYSGGTAHMQPSQPQMDPSAMSTQPFSQQLTTRMMEIQKFVSK
jgi:hypothetical protein